MGLSFPDMTAGHLMIVMFAVFSSLQLTQGAKVQHIPGHPTPQPPRFLTTSGTIRIKKNDTVVLPCEVTNNDQGKYVLVWKRGIAVLTAGGVKVTPDDRVALVDGYNLQISDVQTQDAGDYVCQIGLLQPKEITQTLEILVPPRIDSATSRSEIKVRRGQPVNLECRASGNPVPTISWSRRNNVLPSGESSVESPTLSIMNATRHHAGTYVCTADNTVGPPATLAINVTVYYEPEIEVERPWVHSGVGVETQLVCVVHAAPPAEVIWYRDTLRLDPTEKRLMTSSGSRYILLFPKVSETDFGNYTCCADNEIGKAKETVELSGVPTPVEFRTERPSSSRDSYNVSWVVHSVEPILEYRLHYRRASTRNTPVPGPLTQLGPLKLTPPRKEDPWHSDSTWREVVVPLSPNRSPMYPSPSTMPISPVYLSPPSSNSVIVAAQRGDGLRDSDLFPSRDGRRIHSFVLRNLEQGTTYDVTVIARNRFGWSRETRLTQVTTRGDDPEVRESVTSMNEASRSRYFNSGLLTVLATSIFLGS